MERHDVVIVGGGIAGASLAARIADRANVLVLEAEEQCGLHSTGRSAAFWLASYGAAPVRPLTIASRPMFEAGWPGTAVPLLRQRGAVHVLGNLGDYRDVLQNQTGDANRFVALDVAELTRLVPGLSPAWSRGWLEPTCADIDVAEFHRACLAAVKRLGGEVRTAAGLVSARPSGTGWRIDTTAGPVEANRLVNAAGAWGDEVARRCGVAPLGLVPKRRTMIQVRVGKSGLRDLPLVIDVGERFYFKGEGDDRVWLSPLDADPVEPGDAQPEELVVATALARFEAAVDWPVVAVERAWAGLRTFTPARIPSFGFDPAAAGFFWCVGQGGVGIQTAPAASLLCANLLLGEPLDAALFAIGAEIRPLDPAAFAPRRFDWSPVP